MQQSARLFANKLNQCLDELGMPNNIKERAAHLSKMTHITKQQAWALLEGHIFPDAALLQQIATELEIDAEWLTSQE